MANWYVRDTGTLGYTAVAQWQATHTYAVGNIVRQLATPSAGNYRCFRVSAITTGISGGSEPAWTLTKNGTTVDSGVTWTECTGQALYNGDGGGSAWGAPFHSIAEAVATGWPAAGDTFYVGSDHNVTFTTAQAYVGLAGTSNNPFKVISVPTSTIPPTSKQAGATESTTGAVGFTFGLATVGLGYYIYGLTLNAGSGASVANISNIGTTASQSMTTESCTFNINNSATTSGVNLTIGGNTRGQWWKSINDTYTFGATAQGIQLGTGRVEIINASIAQTGTVPSTLLSTPGGTGGIAVIRDTDLSKITSALCSATVANSGNIIFQNCKLANGVSISTGAFNTYADNWIRLQNCDSSATNYRNYLANYMGTLQQSTSTYRNGGASDGTTPVSLQIVSTANPSFVFPFVSDPILFPQYVQSGTAITANIYLTSSSTLTNAQVWVEFEYLGSSATPIGTSDLSTRAADMFATPSTLTTDSTSTWTGGQTNNYVISLTLTPNLKGCIGARIYVGSASKTIYVDPSIYISGYYTSGEQYLIPGNNMYLNGNVITWNSLLASGD